jgi:ribonuclease BN (tRNA processing enzyme)
LRLTVIGCSPAWPNDTGAHSGYLVEGSGSVLLDCGPGVLGRLRVRSGWPDVAAVVVTHFHLDHWGDLVPWVWGALHLRGRGAELTRPELWVPPGGGRQLERFGELLGFPDMFERVFDVHEYAPRSPFAVAGLTFTAARVPHYMLEAYALRVSDNGRSLAYSGDCGPGGELIELARDADLFVCEATLESGDMDGQPRGHLSLDEAVESFERSGARRLLLTHRPNELPVAGSVELAHEGLVCELA